MIAWPPQKEERSASGASCLVLALVFARIQRNHAMAPKLSLFKDMRIVGSETIFISCCGRGWSPPARRFACNKRSRWQLTQGPATFTIGVSSMILHAL